MFLSNENFVEISLPNSEIEENQENLKSFSPFVAAMKCISATMQNKIISSDNDRIGVLCYSTVKKFIFEIFKLIYF